MKNQLLIQKIKGREILDSRGNPTVEVDVILENGFMEQLGQQVRFSFWQRFDENHTVIRFATSWATREEDVDALIALL